MAQDIAVGKPGGERTIVVWPPIDSADYAFLPVVPGKLRTYANIYNYHGGTFLRCTPRVFSEPDSSDLLEHSRRLAADMRCREMRLGHNATHSLIGFRPVLDEETVEQVRLYGEIGTMTAISDGLRLEVLGAVIEDQLQAFLMYAIKQVAPLVGGVVLANTMIELEGAKTDLFCVA